jgi:hypothetical protein
VRDDDGHLVCAPSLDCFKNENTRCRVQRGHCFICTRSSVPRERNPIK